MSYAWSRHQMETFFALLALYVGNLPVTGEFPSQRPVMRSFDVLFDLHLNKRLSKQLRGWRFETPSRLLWCHGNSIIKTWSAEVGILLDSLIGNGSFHILSNSPVDCIDTATVGRGFVVDLVERNFSIYFLPLFMFKTLPTFCLLIFFSNEFTL